MRVERTDVEKRIDLSFKKTYGDRVYVFKIEVTEQEGDKWVNVVVRQKPKDAKSTAVGKVVHLFQFNSFESWREVK